MFDTPASRLSVSNERHSDAMGLIERGVPQLAHIGGSFFFIKYWCVSDMCPIRILLIEVSIFLVKFGEEDHVWMIFQFRLILRNLISIPVAIYCSKLFLLWILRRVG